MDGLEEQLVAVHPLVRRLLQLQQRVGVQVPLVVALALPRQHRLGEVLGLVGRHERSILRTCPTSSPTRPRSAPRRTRRSRSGCGRARSTSSSASSTCSGPGSALRRSIEDDRLRSLILYGPPGVGKTTLARIVAEATGAAFEELSAVAARVDDVRRVIQNARDRLGGNGQRTILFLDEIHRFNKAQQDAMLPAVEEGLVTLIGATTENPYFEVNSALLSRCQVIELVALGEEELLEVVRRGAEAIGAEVPPGRGHVDRAPGRRRRADGPEHARARLGDRAGRGGAARGAARRGRGAQAAAPLRQGRRPALRLRLGLHQVDARLRSRRRRLLPRRDARGR